MLDRPPLLGQPLFTLGLASSPREGATVVTFVAAATGLVVVALQIGYLPTIYGAYNRRETLVNMLESRAGELAAVVGGLEDGERDGIREKRADTHGR